MLACADSATRPLVFTSFFEIYGAQAFDLLNERALYAAALL